MAEKAIQRKEILLINMWIIELRLVVVEHFCENFFVITTI